MRVDSHHHLWSLARGDYSWMSPDFTAIYKDFAPGDLAPHLRAAGIEKTVVVQAADTVAETEFLLGLADQTDWIAGVVGWVNFTASDAVNTLEQLAKHPKFKGVRPMIQDIADDDWVLSTDLDPVFEAICELGLRFDALVLPRHLSRLLRRLERHPDLPCVVDHAAKPDLRTGDIAQWSSDMRSLSESTNAFCKLSGLLTEAHPGAGPLELKPVTDHIFSIFGEKRLMFGSDWPVLEMASNYATWVSVVESLLDGYSPSQQNAIWGDSAVSFYGL